MNLSYFHQKNSEGDVLLDSNNKPLLRDRNTKKLAVLQAHIDQGSDIETLNRVCGGVIELEQWRWFDEYHEHLENLEQVNVFNANLPVISQAENGDDVFADPKDLPDEPIRPTLLTVEEFKAANKGLFDSYSKSQGIVINGIKISLGNANADGLMQIKTFYDIAKEVACDLAESMVFPTNLDARTASGEVKVPIKTYNEFIQYSLQFAAARSEFF